MKNKSNHSLFLLTHNSFDKNGHFVILLYGVSADGCAVKCVIDTFRPLFFIPRNTPQILTRSADMRKPLSLKTMEGNMVDCLYFRTYHESLKCIQLLKDKSIRTYESDIYPTERFLMERLVCGGFVAEGVLEGHHYLPIYKNPKIRGVDIDINLSVCSLDIETNGFTNELYSIACHGLSDIVFMIGNSQDNEIVKYVSSEKDLLYRFMIYMKDADPDIIIGWNVINFDLVMLKRRCEACSIAFEIGRDKGTLVFPKRNSVSQYIARVPGRVIIDVPIMLRANNYSFDSYALNNVAFDILGKKKLIEKSGKEKIKEINRQFVEDKASLAEYNLDDTVLTKEIFDKTNLIANAIERSKQSGHLIDQYGGSIAAFDYLYLPLFHRKGYVACNVADIKQSFAPLTGGYVMESKPGIYRNVLLLDFKSLYPTIIITFKVDPLGAIVTDGDLITGPSGKSFSGDHSILPLIIQELLDARSQAKINNNKPLSYAIKILMNSFYGVLGSTGCRFFSRNLAQAITETGQYILKTTCAYIEQKTPYKIIYGDTDSLFLLLGDKHDEDAKEIGHKITQDVNEWLGNHVREKFQTDSALELEFETHFDHFFMPSIRGSSQGSKKRYCGVVTDGGKFDLMFKGLESARSDWTELAKEFQKILYTKVFKQEPVEEYIIATVKSVRNRLVDKKLIYRKQLRKKISEYTTNIPPHAQAAKLLDNPGRIIRYYITIDGPQPIEKCSSKLNYEHYIETQLRPIADSILEWIHLDFDNIISGQQDLFSDQYS